MSSKLFKDFEARVEYLKCSVSAASSSVDSRAHLSDAIVKQFVSQLTGQQLDASQAGHLFGVIKEGPFSEVQRCSIQY